MKERFAFMCILLVICGLQNGVSCVDSTISGEVSGNFNGMLAFIHVNSISINGFFDGSLNGSQVPQHDSVSNITGYIVGTFSSIHNDFYGYISGNFTGTIDETYSSSSSVWPGPGTCNGWYDDNGVWHHCDCSGDGEQDDDDDKGDVKKGLVIGGFVYGGLLTMAFILAITVYCLVQKKHKATRVAQEQILPETYNMSLLPHSAYPRQPLQQDPPAYNTLSASELGKAPDYTIFQNNGHNEGAVESNPRRPTAPLGPIQNGQIHQPSHGPGLSRSPLPPIVRHFETSAP